MDKVYHSSKKINQSIPRETNPECSLQGLMLKLQYFGHLMRRTNSLEKTLMLGKSEGRRRRGQQRMRGLDGTTNSMGMENHNHGKLTNLITWTTALSNSIKL